MTHNLGYERSPFVKHKGFLLTHNQKIITRWKLEHNLVPCAFQKSAYKGCHLILTKRLSRKQETI